MIFCLAGAGGGGLPRREKLYNICFQYEYKLIVHLRGDAPSPLPGLLVVTVGCNCCLGALTHFTVIILSSHSLTYTPNTAENYAQSGILPYLTDWF